MALLKSKRLLLIISVVILVAASLCMIGMNAKYTSQRDLHSSVQISLLLQGDEADMYESPVTPKPDGSYEIQEVNKKEQGSGEGNEPSRGNNYEYVMPGVNIPKDPKLFITKKSGAPAYLYIEVLEDNFPGNYTNNGFDELSEAEDNVYGTDAVYYQLKDYWEPVYTDKTDNDGNLIQLKGKNDGNIFVYKNDNAAFAKYKVDVDKNPSDFDATYLASYIMEEENLKDTDIEMDKYYGLNEVKDSNAKYPCFEILEGNKVYISEKFIHDEYYSTLAPDAEIDVDGNMYNFGLYFYGYMASAKLDGKFVTPLEAYEYCKNDFFDEAGYKAEYDKEHSINNN